jgi:hypothetical protein
MTTLTAVLDRSVFLRRVLLVDAATGVATGLLMTLDSGPLAPLLGHAFVIAQAVVVALLAELEFAGLRRLG